jgi:phosphoribosylaminoimidazole-succinocarboxamide synthase
MKSYLGPEAFRFCSEGASGFPPDLDVRHGKVRDLIFQQEELILLTSDRISAFDVVLGTIPFKGQVLNELALYWFTQTEDIAKNHIRTQIGPRSIAVKKCEVLPIEVVVRGYLTGSAWRDYRKGKAISGIELPTGYKADQKFDQAIITPSTKAEMGDHDEPISREAILGQGLVDKDLYEELERTALKLFHRGTELAAQRGLILVDTKYEFGLSDGELIVIDEIHTPDSSRYWYTDHYQRLFEEGKSQKKVDKEFLREWLMDHDFSGQGQAPNLPDELRLEVADKYITAFELLTGKEFSPNTESPEAETKKILSYIATGDLS